MVDSASRGGRSSVGRAPGCGPGGRGFESPRSPSRKAPVYGDFSIGARRAAVRDAAVVPVRCTTWGAKFSGRFARVIAPCREYSNNRSRRLCAGPCLGAEGPRSPSDPSNAHRKRRGAAIRRLPPLARSSSLNRWFGSGRRCCFFVNAEVSDSRRVLPDLLKLSSQVGAGRDSRFDPMVSTDFALSPRKTVGLARRSSDRRERVHCSQSSLAAQIDGAARLRLDCWRLLSGKACQAGASLWRPFRGGRFSCRAACGAWTRALGSSRSGRGGVSV